MTIPATSTRGARIGTAQSRMTRVLFGGTAATGIAFSAIALRKTLAQAPDLSPLWAVIVTVLLWGLPILMLVAAPRASLSRLRSIAIVFLFAYPAAVLSWPLAQLPGRIETGEQPWVIDLLAVACFSAALVLPPVGAWIYFGLMCLAAGALRYIADGSRDLFVPLQDTVFNSVTVAVFIAIVFATLRAGAQRDAEAETTAADAVIAAAAEAESRERAHVAALTHDDVISTLLAAARATDATEPLVRRSASRALERLDALSEVEVDARAEIDAEALVGAVRDAVDSIAPDSAFAGSTDGPLVLPATTARALVEATGEALRNSVRHAAGGSKAAVSRAVTVIVGNGTATVEIVDDGVGFDRRAVALERFGIRYSIRHRMSSVPGGSATIDSTPGRGTRVVLRWQAGS